MNTLSFLKYTVNVTFERALKKKFEKLIKNAKNIIRVGYFQSGEANNFKILLVIKYYNNISLLTEKINACLQWEVIFQFFSACQLTDMEHCLKGKIKMK